MRVVFFSGFAISHLIPLKSTILFLKKNNYDVYVFATKNNKYFIKKMGAKYIEYPEDYWNPLLDKESKKYNEIIEENYKNKDFEKMLYYILKKDAMLAFNHNLNSMDWIRKKIINLMPNIIFRDSTDIYWNYLKYEFSNIKTIGYITNNLYNWNYFKKNKLEFSYFLGIADVLQYLPDDYLDKFDQVIKEIYQEIIKEYHTLPLEPYFQYDPNETFNLIYTIDSMQPNCFDSKRYMLVESNKEDMLFKDTIDNNLVDFIGNSKTIYVSNGSFISRNIDYYKFIINHTKNFDSYKVIISAGNNNEEVKKYVKDNKLDHIFFVNKFIPQKYVLNNNCSLFITSGGINSIKEAIFYKVPMFVIPVSCEQRLNGLIIEKKGIGYTSYGPHNRLFNIEENFKVLLSSKKIKKNITNICLACKQKNNEDVFKKIIEYINEE